MSTTTQIPDMQIGFGDVASIKATAEGEPLTLEGYGIRFGSPDQTDISKYKDYFTPNTKLGKAPEVSGFFHHGLPVYVGQPGGGRKSIGPGSDEIGVARAVRTDDAGVWYEIVLDCAKEYQEQIRKMAEKKAIGFSSGAVTHLVKRVAVLDDKGNVKAHEITQWPVGEMSLTFAPAEPRNIVSIAEFKTALAEFSGDSEVAEVAAADTPSTLSFSDHGDHVLSTLSDYAARAVGVVNSNASKGVKAGRIFSKANLDRMEKIHAEFAGLIALAKGEQSDAETSTHDAAPALNEPTDATQAEAKTVTLTQDQIDAHLRAYRLAR